MKAIINFSAVTFSATIKSSLHPDSGDVAIECPDEKLFQCRQSKPKDQQLSLPSLEMVLAEEIIGKRLLGLLTKDVVLRRNVMLHVWRRRVVLHLKPQNQVSQYQTKISFRLVFKIKFICDRQKRDQDSMFPLWSCPCSTRKWGRRHLLQDVCH